MDPARPPTTTASTRASCSTCRGRARRARCSSAPERNGYMYVLDRATGEVLSAEPFGTSRRRSRRRPEDRPAHVRAEQGAAAGEGRARHLSRRAGRQGLAAVGVVAAHAAALRPAPEPLHGLRGHGGELHRRHAVRRRERDDATPARAATAASSRPGTRRRSAKVWTHPRDIPGVERRAGDRGRRRVLRHDGRLVQGGGRAYRRGALALQERLRDHRPADHATAARTASSTSPFVAGVGGWPGAIVVRAALDRRDNDRGATASSARGETDERRTRKVGTPESFALPCGAACCSLCLLARLRARDSAASGTSRRASAMPSTRPCASALSRCGTCDAATGDGLPGERLRVSRGQAAVPWFNCTGCHAQGGGEIGPALMDDEWIYGSAPEQRLREHRAGAAQRHALVRRKLPIPQVWQLVAYVRSMSGLTPDGLASARADPMQVQAGRSSRARQKPKSNSHATSGVRTHASRRRGVAAARRAVGARAGRAAGGADRRTVWVVCCTPSDRRLRCWWWSRWRARVLAPAPRGERPERTRLTRAAADVAVGRLGTRPSSSYPVFLSFDHADGRGSPRADEAALHDRGDRRSSGGGR